MSLRDELESAIELHGRIASNWEWEDTYNQACAELIRDHGQALLDALEKVDRSPSNVDDGLSVAYMVGKLDGQGQASATTLIAYVLDNYEGHAATEESMHIWLSECIDAARSKTVDGGSV